MSGAPRIAVFLAFSGKGGVERMVVRLLAGLVDRGYAVDLVAVRADRLPGPLPAGVRLVDTGHRHSQMAVLALARYLRRERPVALLAAKDRAIRTAIVARALARVPVHLAGRLGTNLSAALAGRSRLGRWLRYAPMRVLYHRVDRVVAVSEGVAEDTRRIAGLAAGRVCVVRNPVVSPDLAEQARAEPDHPWLREPGPPVILGAGRLTRQKDFPTLLRAFARLRAGRPARLVILGDGGQRGALEAQAAELGVADDLALPGHVANPYAWMARASLFVLSSAWEGSPNVLTEAVALGTPVVATDCPSGPRELLADGRFGPLVAVGDDIAMAAAMAAVLDAPLPPETLRGAAAGYTLEASAAGYLRALGLDERAGTP
ncbi:glycosyltransferase [Arhodomonas aquaeolei]|uniref:glycosyltransferase n=3 Tax=Arhodomonas TaxID=2368 RepID=UPI00036D424D|nr:glycosyltransferase [Arhodomonas aquaeolei]